MTFTQFFWLMLIAFLVALAARRLQVRYALALVITGLVIGIPRLLPQTHLDPQVLLTIFLPPLLFDSAIHLRLGALRRNWKPIAIYTLAGTVLSTFIVGALMAWVLHIALAPALVFGALISTTDPISVIAVFKRLGAGRRLTLIMEAESLFNNDTAVVLFTITLGAALGGHASLAQGVFQFVQLMAGGALLGLGIGALASRIHYELDDHLIEITLTSVIAFGAYLGAEALHVSGVMAVVTAGLVIGNFAMPRNMSASTQLAVVAFWEYAAFVVNSIVFLLIGIEVSYVDWSNKVGLTCAAVLMVLAGRAMVYPLSWIVNRLQGEVPMAWQHVLFWGGLRGALSMALVLGLRPGFPQRETFVAATFGVVFFSLLAQGLTIGPLLKHLGLSQGREQAPVSPGQRRLASEIMACEAALVQLERWYEEENYPNWAVESLLHEYRNRLRLLQHTMQAVHPEHQVLLHRQTHRARQLALAAEKRVFQEEMRQGWLSEEDWRGMVARLDAELLELKR